MRLEPSGRFIVLKELEEECQEMLVTYDSEAKWDLFKVISVGNEVIEVVAGDIVTIQKKDVNFIRLKSETFLIADAGFCIKVIED
jgi:exo-beta-1,3-glucanase (GH17 family)